MIVIISNLKSQQMNEIHVRGYLIKVKWRHRRHEIIMVCGTNNCIYLIRNPKILSNTLSIWNITPHVTSMRKYLILFQIMQLAFEEMNTGVISRGLWPRNRIFHTQTRKRSGTICGPSIWRPHSFSLQVILEINWSLRNSWVTQTWAWNRCKCLAMFCRLEACCWSTFVQD